MMNKYYQLFKEVDKIKFANYGIDRSGLIIEWYKDKGHDEVEQLILSPTEAAKLMYDADLVDKVDVVNGYPVLHFSTISDWCDYQGEHEQHEESHQMTWNDYVENYPLDLSYAKHLLMTKLYLQNK